ncbi:hypothetical protein CEXT_657141 [Caerostris extrusa]|uniref:Uncharacterized protein n=1 Tax=Caerostris extrusa TaxID=172846 RepID=A0AAV4V2C6_CAEEX|nr:hypothetical protein CEXT_657141 [Caerostris extrusa]
MYMVRVKIPSYLANATSCRIYIAAPDDDVGILQWVLCFCSAINPDSKTKKVEMSRWLLSSPELNSVARWCIHFEKD